MGDVNEMKQKFLTFKSSYSPVQISINQGHANVLEDWRRLDWESTRINGQKLSEIFENLNINIENLDENSLSKFFTDVILKDYTGDKRQALEVLLSSFHQGGLLHPVSAGMAHVLRDEEFGAGSHSDDNKKQVHIKTSDTGFTLQEIYTVNKCKASITASDEFWTNFTNGVILPDSGNTFVFQAQATMNVSFQEGNPAPTVQVKNNTINFGSNYVKNIADTRSWLNTFVDFLKNLFGTNKVENLSMSEDANVKPSMKP